MNKRGDEEQVDRYNKMLEQGKFISASGRGDAMNEEYDPKSERSDAILQQDISDAMGYASDDVHRWIKLLTKVCESAEKFEGFNTNFTKDEQHTVMLLARLAGHYITGKLIGRKL